MAFNPQKAASTIARGSARADEMSKEGSSPFDVWTFTGEGLSEQGRQIVNDPEEAMAAELDGRARQLDAIVSGETSAISLSQAKESMKAQAEDITDAAAKVAEADGALATTGAVFNLLTSVEQMISTPLAAIPFPSFPAVRITDQAIGLPHAHAHPPNLTPPNPVPVPMPSTGPVIPIPFVSGASRVLINGISAGRCGDMGMGVWCGGYFPLYEIFLGSSSVWIEGARAARVGIDITKHCIFTTPRPTDPPIGPMIGSTVSSSPNVSIGGFPMPSLLSVAMGAAFKAAFSGLSRLRNLARAADDVADAADSGISGFSRMSRSADDTGEVTGVFRRTPESDVTGVFRRPSTIDESLANYQRALNQVEDLERRGAMVMGGDPALQQAARSDMIRIAMSEEGRLLMDDIATGHANHGSRVHLNPQPAGTYSNGPHVSRPPGWGSRDPDGAPGVPVDSTVTYTPGVEGGGARGTRNTPSDVVLIHELHHGNTAQNGVNSSKVAATKPGYPNMEEEMAVATENAYRRERGLPTRIDYDDLP
jgi:uncharacterized Zn-binding protein involved in type VI secretion